MCEDVAMRARNAKKTGRTVHLSLGYSKRAAGGGFSRSYTMSEATNDTMALYRACVGLFDKFHDGSPVRRLDIRLTHLEDEYAVQLSLFDEGNWRNRKLGETMDAIRHKYGTAAILRAASYTKAGTARERERLVGGHFK